VAARVVQASDRKIRLREVDQEDSIGTARREAMGSGIRERREDRDIFVVDSEITRLK
jgi:hypothetical protein